MWHFSWLDPVPAFPPYTGPYKVGTVDVEIPAADLDNGSCRPNPDIHTVSFRIFYPCGQVTGEERPVRWLPSPKRAVLSAFARFMGSGSMLADVFSMLPLHLHYITIPVHRNAPLLTPPTESGRFPVVVFSHGLGGSSKAYSYILGSLASHGAVAIAPNHRDGSAPIQFVRETGGRPATTVPYKVYSHKPSPEVYQGRDEMLRIRLWELKLIHGALLRINRGEHIDNLDPNSQKKEKREFNEVLKMFAGKLDVEDPGAIIWAGHSFGAATVIQLVKSVYWRPTTDEQSDPIPLMLMDDNLTRQITPSTPLILLDLWTLPLQSPWTQWLRQKSLPCYDPIGPGGRAVLSILSEGFFKWSANLEQTKKAIRPPSGFSPSSAQSDSQPLIFYPIGSAHLSQSDFGILFARFSKLLFKVADPERTMRLNIRAMLQHLRRNGVEIAETSPEDMEMEKIDQAIAKNGEKTGDWKILDSGGQIPGWIVVPADAVDEVVGEDESEEEIMKDEHMTEPVDAVA